MVRPVRLVVLLAVVLSAVVALAAPGSASARLTPAGERLHVVVVDRISDATWAELAHRGAVGLLRPSYGPTTNRRRALAELVRGTEVNARLGGVPAGKPLINTNKARVYPELQDVHRRPVAAARQADVERPALPHRRHRRRLPRAAHVAHHAHSRPRLGRRHRADHVAGTPDDDALLDTVEGRDRPAVPARPRDRLEQPAQVRRPLHPRGSAACPCAARPPRGDHGDPGRAARQPRSRDGAGLERGTAVRRALRGNGAPGVRPRAQVSQRVGAPCALRRRGRPLRLRDGHAAGVAGGEPVRADAELAVLGDRQPDRDAAARAAPRGGVPRAKALRDRGLRRVRRLRARGDDGQPAGLRRRRCDRARHRARGARGAAVQARSARLRRSARVRGGRRALDRLAGARPPGPEPLAQRVRRPRRGAGLVAREPGAALVRARAARMADGRSSSVRARCRLHALVALRT